MTQYCCLQTHGEVGRARLTRSVMTSSHSVPPLKESEVGGRLGPPPQNGVTFKGRSTKNSSFSVFLSLLHSTTASAFSHTSQLRPISSSIFVTPCIAMFASFARQAASTSAAATLRHSTRRNFSSGNLGVSRSLC